MGAAFEPRATRARANANDEKGDRSPSKAKVTAPSTTTEQAEPSNSSRERRADLKALARQSLSSFPQPLPVTVPSLEPRADAAAPPRPRRPSVPPPLPPEALERRAIPPPPLPVSWASPRVASPSMVGPVGAAPAPAPAPMPASSLAPSVASVLPAAHEPSFAARHPYAMGAIAGVASAIAAALMLSAATRPDATAAAATRDVVADVAVARAAFDRGRAEPGAKPVAPTEAPAPGAVALAPVEIEAPAQSAITLEPVAIEGEPPAVTLPQPALEAAPSDANAPEASNPLTSSNANALEEAMARAIRAKIGRAP